MHIRDVQLPEFAGTGMERNTFPFKKDLSLSGFFFSFLERVFPLFLIFLGVSTPIFRRSFPVFSSFHLSKPVPCFLMGLNLAILERVLNKNLSKPVLPRSKNLSYVKGSGNGGHYRSLNIHFAPHPRWG